MQFSLCIEPVLPDLEFTERIGTVAAMGWRQIEFWEPGDKNLTAVRGACEQAGVAISDCTFNDGWGETRLHAETEAVVRNFETTVKLLREVGCTKAICLTGESDPSRSMAEQKTRVVENLRALAPLAERAGITLLLEALNTRVDHPGYFLDSSALGFEIMREVDHPRVKLLYDVYHMQIMEGNIIDTVTRNIELIGHFHSAGVPGRGELFTGELDYLHIIEAIDKAGYSGSFGVEYWPTMDQRESLEKTARYLGLS